MSVYSFIELELSKHNSRCNNLIHYKYTMLFVDFFIVDLLVCGVKMIKAVCPPTIIFEGKKLNKVFFKKNVCCFCLMKNVSYSGQHNSITLDSGIHTVYFNAAFFFISD